MRKLLLAAIFVLAANAETHKIVADRYYRTFSHQNAVLKRIKPGDVVVTKTLDSGGHDDKDVKRHPESGNPRTGAFYIEGAEPGDAIRVTFQKMRLNRNWGYSSLRLGLFALTPEYVEHLFSPNFKPDVVRKGSSTLVRWELDLANNMVRLRDPASARVKLEYPARPMLGCVGVAAPGDVEQAPVSKGARHRIVDVDVPKRVGAVAAADDQHAAVAEQRGGVADTRRAHVADGRKPVGGWVVNFGRGHHRVTGVETADDEHRAVG